MAMVLQAILPKMCDILVRMVEDEIGMLLGIPGEIEKLREMLSDINNVIEDAEGRRINNRAIEKWLKDLRDVMYDVDDILDLCGIKAEERYARASISPFAGCIHALSCFSGSIFAHKIGTRIKEINLKLQSISRRKTIFDLRLNTPEDYHAINRRNLKTSPVIESDIVGDKIEQDAKRIVEMLMKDDVPGNVSVIAIVGVGGIGKTTLAQKVFDDQKIKVEFQKRVWICVSQDYNEIEILKDIIVSGGGVHADAQSRSLLEPRLEDTIREKKFLLVLDDVWIHHVWDNLLRNPLNCSAIGSKVLITTRKEVVARHMKAVYLHHVEKLQLEDGWSLLMKKVALDMMRGESESLKDIGLQIVTKCDGLPLAIKAIGGVLCTREKTRNAWGRVLQNPAWSSNALHDEVNSALYLSYDDLPSYLKNCFVYCSLFPEDKIVAFPEVVQLWIAEGFVHHDGSSALLEEIGEGYYRELITRNLLEPDPKGFDCLSFKMHDVLRSFAKLLAQDESLVVGETYGPNEGLTCRKPRRLSLIAKTVESNMLRKHNSIRTLMLVKSSISNGGDLSYLPRLRVLDLSCSNIAILPESLCQLAHLRYLNLSGSMVRTIPQSIGNMKNLQCISLQYCRYLSGLPDSVMDLHNLRALHLIGTKLNDFPLGLSKLQNLTELGGFMPNLSSSRSSSLDELGPLFQLRLLYIDGLERVSNSNEARGAKLQSKLHLRRMAFLCTPRNENHGTTMEEKQDLVNIFNNLCPPPCLEYHKIKGYFGCSLPRYLAKTALPCLRVLLLEDCPFFEKLPALGQLPGLEYFWVIGAQSVVNIGHEFFDNNEPPDSAKKNHLDYAFPKLETLGFEKMLHWKQWQWRTGKKAMPKLKNLTIRNCPCLTSFPEALLHQATSLEVLRVSGAGSLREITSLGKLKELDIDGNTNIERVLDLPSLRTLRVKDCPNFVIAENLGALECMEFTDFSTETLPEFLAQVNSEKLRIWCSAKLLSAICTLGTGLEWHKINHMQDVKVYSEYRSQYAFYTKTPFSFTTRIADVDGRP